jgi:NADPH:quinone reductase-like Zn-dependent oxidoreductase
VHSYHLSANAPALDIPGAALGLAQRESDTPEPGPGQVLVRLRASALNYADLSFLAGHMPHAEGLIPLLDGAGEVAAVGPGVQRWQAGDRVIANPHQNWLAGELRPPNYGAVLGGMIDGTLRDYALVPETGLAATPEHLSDEEAAALPCAGLTAWNSIMGGPPHRRVCAPGESVLVQGTGGVALFLLQFAKLAGCRAIALTSTAEKAEFLRELGADAVINYRENPAWGDSVVELTGGRGVDLAVELGGPGTLPESIKAVRPGGRLALIGIVGGMGSVDYLHMIPIIHKALTLFANSMGSLADLENMLQAVSLHQLRPHIDRVFAFDEAAEAYRYFAGRGHIGKVVIRHD